MFRLKTLKGIFCELGKKYEAFYNRLFDFSGFGGFVSVRS